MIEVNVYIYIYIYIKHYKKIFVYKTICIYVSLCYRYIVATQDRELQEKLRTIPGVPILYLHGKVPTLESPSEASRVHAETLQKGLGMTTWENENIKELRKCAGIVEENVKLKKRKKKGGPNPLSCLKKKKKPKTVSLKQNESGKIRKRKKIKIASHVKEALITELKNNREATKNT